MLNGLLSRSVFRFSDTLLLRELLAGIDVRAPVFDALGMIHRALADDLAEQKVGDQVDLALLQRRRRIGHARRKRLELFLLHAVATPVAVGELVESRHARAWPSALDRHRQTVAIELRLAQVGAIRHLVIRLAAI